MEGIIDLRFCKEGDILITSQGLKMKYLEPTLKGHFYDHHVQYLDGKYKSNQGDGNSIIWQNNEYLHNRQSKQNYNFRI